MIRPNHHVDSAGTSGAVARRFRRRIFRLDQFADELLELMGRLPDFWAVWSAQRVDPTLREAVMLGVALENRCRYCVFAHTAWGRHVGLSQRELDELLSGAAGPADSAIQLAVLYARARVAADFGPVAQVLERRFRQHFGATAARNIETVIRAINLANRCGNTVDALLSRLDRIPAEESRLLDELAISAIWLAAVPWLVPAMIVHHGGPFNFLRSLSRFLGTTDHSQ